MLGEQLADTLNDNFKNIDKNIDKLKQELIDTILLDNVYETRSVYDMTVDEYMELPGNVRL